MNKTFIQRWLSLSLCVVLIAAVALTFTGCIDNLPGGETTTAPTETPAGEYTVKGEGNTVFYFHVVDGEGKETKFEIHTDKTTVGAALIELGLIEGDEGDYGLYVKKVNGITADYDVDGTYWALYEGDNYAMQGVELTEIQPGATYAFKVSK